MIKTARKEYNCMAWEWLSNDELETGVLTFSELRSIVKVGRNKGKILKGEKYLCAPGVCIDESNNTRKKEPFRAIPEIDAICKRLGIYQYQ